MCSSRACTFSACSCSPPAACAAAALRPPRADVAHRAPDRRGAGVLPAISAAHRLHFARAHRHALSRLHADRRPAAAGAVRRARRRLRLRHVSARPCWRRRSSHDADEFAPTLRTIRYRNGVVALARAQPLFLRVGPNTTSRTRSAAPSRSPARSTWTRRVYWHRALGRRRFAMRGHPAAPRFSPTRAADDGDIVGFVTRRPNLDYFHVGFVAFGTNGELLLRHASQTPAPRGRRAAWRRSWRRIACVTSRCWRPQDRRSTRCYARVIPAPP